MKNPFHTRWPVLNKVRTVLTKRDREHGDAMQNLKDAATIWSVILNSKVSARQVADCLEVLKIVRSVSGGNNFDNYVDRIGYAALAVEAAEIEDEEPHTQGPKI